MAADSLFEIKVHEEVFNDNFKHFVTAIQSSVDEVTHECLSKRLITPATHRELLESPNTPGKKAGSLLVALRDCLKHNEKCFSEFLGILEKQLIYKGLIEKVKNGMDEVRNRKTTALCTEDHQQKADLHHSTSKDSGFESSIASSSIFPDYLDTPPSSPPELKRQNSVFGLEGEVSVPSECSQTSMDLICGGKVVSISQDQNCNSIDSRTTVVDPIEEYKPVTECNLKQRKNTQWVGNHGISQKPSSNNSSIGQIDLIVESARNLRYDIQQREAREIALDDNIKQLSLKLGSALKEKKLTEDLLEKKSKETEALKREREEEVALLKSQITEADGLRSQLSKSEVDLQRMLSERKVSEERIKTLEEKLSTVKEEKKELKIKLKEDEKNTFELRARIYQLERDNLKFMLKLKKSDNTTRELCHTKENVKCLREMLKLRSCYLYVCIITCALLVMCIAYALYYHYWYDFPQCNS